VAERPHRLTIAAVLLTLALSIGIGIATAPAATAFPDPVGDVQGGAGPDITSIVVSHTASSVTFRFRFASAPPLGLSARKGWVDMLLVGIDVPPRSLKRTPHGWVGLDYHAGLHGTQTTAILVKASPTRPSQPRGVVTRPKVTVRGHTLSFSLSRAKLGNPAWIEFVVAAGRETSDQAAGEAATRHPTAAASTTGCGGELRAWGWSLWRPCSPRRWSGSYSRAGAGCSTGQAAKADALNTLAWPRSRRSCCSGSVSASSWSSLPQSWREATSPASSTCPRGRPRRTARRPPRGVVGGAAASARASGDRVALPPGRSE
jgi:hypothetical protein